MSGNLEDMFSGMDKAPTEASSDIRQGAKGIRELYVSLLAEGFTTTQAMQIVLTGIASAER
jgi:hypothetical protein